MVRKHLHSHTHLRVKILSVLKVPQVEAPAEYTSEPWFFLTKQMSSEGKRVFLDEQIQYLLC